MSEGKLRLVGGRAVREVRRWVGHRDARGWPPYSRLLLLSDSPKWVLAYEMSELAGVARRLGICVADSRLHAYVRRQSVFYASQFALLNGRQYRQPNRLATAYFHGKPGTGVAEFDRAFEALRGCHDRLDRVQVSHREMRDIVLELRHRRCESASHSHCRRSAALLVANGCRRKPPLAKPSAFPRERPSSDRFRRTASAGAMAMSRSS